MESSDYSKGERGELYLQPSSYDSRRTTGTGEDRDTCAMRLLCSFVAFKILLRIIDFQYVIPITLLHHDWSCQLNCSNSKLITLLAPCNILRVCLLLNMTLITMMVN